MRDLHKTGCLQNIEHQTLNINHRINGNTNFDKIKRLAIVLLIFFFLPGIFAQDKPAKADKKEVIEEVNGEEADKEEVTEEIEGEEAEGEDVTEGVEGEKQKEEGEVVEEKAPAPKPKKKVLPMFATGKIKKLELTNAPVSWVYNKDVYIARNKGLSMDVLLDTFEFMDLATKEKRYPKKGFIFALIDVKLKKGRSIGKYDYVLKRGNKAYQCQALTKEKGFFDPTIWKFKYESEFVVYSLLYEVPKEINEFHLHVNLDITIPQKDVKIEFTQNTVELTPEQCEEQESLVPRARENVVGENTTNTIDTAPAKTTQPTKKTDNLLNDFSW
ncbi:MAG: hypothetical protein U9O87_02765 [Verrucomicrobiota bacterium]|nr:hypothetical protein [Verrucomicrobiota bacterium]